MKTIAKLDKGYVRWVSLALLLAGAWVTLRADASDTASNGLRAAAALLVVLGIAFLGTHGLKSWSQRGHGQARGASVPIHVLGAKGLGDGRSLLVVEVEGDRFLISQGRDAVVLLAQLSASDACSGEPMVQGEAQ
jgi:flagellar biogenesis protein FliO